MLLLFAFVFLTQACLAFTAGVMRFYEPAIDHIDVVTHENYTDVVKNSDRFVYMEFYANWCGYSKRFIPHWKALARETLLWHKNVLRLTAIDCADMANVEVCYRNHIRAYPLFGVFNAFSNQDSAIMAEDENSRSEKFMRTIIDFLEKHKKVPKNWPELLPYLNDIDNIFTDDTHIKYSVLILEPDSSYVGRQVTLDFSNYQDKIEIRRVTATTNPNVFKRANVPLDSTSITPILVTNTHEAAKKYELFSDALKNLKTDSVINSDLISDEILNRERGVEQAVRYELTGNIFKFMKYTNLEFDPSAIDL